MRISDYSNGQTRRSSELSIRRRQTGHAAETAGRPLDVTDFAAVVAATPLVAIDLLLRNEKGQVLFGRRSNPPAQGSWFVPGGRIYKNETLDAAFRRIAQSELGLAIERSASRLMGVFQHFYDTNFLGEPGIDTHYIVLAHEFVLPMRPANLPRQQHSEYLWLPEAEISLHSNVHPYAKAYFRNE
jgi:colanic acid biosynthesis protein WcaH